MIHQSEHMSKCQRFGNSILLVPSLSTLRSDCDTNPEMRGISSHHTLDDAMAGENPNNMRSSGSAMLWRVGKALGKYTQNEPRQCIVSIFLARQLITNENLIFRCRATHPVFQTGSLCTKKTQSGDRRPARLWTSTLFEIVFHW